MKDVYHSQPSKINVVDKPVDAINIIRKRFESGYDNDEPFYICNISDIIQKHLNWIKRMPRVTPFYGKTSIYNNCVRLKCDQLISIQPRNVMMIHS